MVHLGNNTNKMFLRCFKHEATQDTNSSDHRYPELEQNNEKKYLQISKPRCFSKLKWCQFLGPSPSRVGRLQSDAAGGPAPAELTMATGTDRWGGGTGGVPPAHGALHQGMVRTPTRHLANLL